MSIRASPDVVRCLSCSAAVDRSVAGACPFCGTDVAAMPVIEPEPLPEEPRPEPVAERPERRVEERPAPVTALAVVPKPRRRRRHNWTAVLVLGVATAAAFTGTDLRLAPKESPARLPSVVIPIAASAPPAAAPSPTLSASPVVHATSEPQGVSRPAQAGCDSFTSQEIERQYAFERDRADLKLQRAQQINDHYYADDHDKKGYDARAKAAADEHTATIAWLDGRVAKARAACDPSLLN